ncbi:MAG: methylenetetrahydrofolate reductase C-terminal domain-containing protein [Anaerolineae bacterium]|nr:methylenetetrahydrofolate reductase C-terminal domain-containing protein [Anaerolineae bacterium]
MIIGEQKPLVEIVELLGDAKKVLVAGCGTCVTVCFAGGEKEVGILASALRMKSKLEGHPMEVDEVTVQRQCEWEYIDPLGERLARSETGQNEYDAVLSLACGIGVQAINERFPDALTLPGLNTTFLGLPEEQGVWEERCQACGDCVLGLTFGICPITRCSKQLLNGPCGGSQNGVCEVNPDVPCAWQLIYDRATALGQLERLLEIQPPKDWSTSRDGGPRKIVREDLMLVEEQ